MIKHVSNLYDKHSIVIGSADTPIQHSKYVRHPLTVKHQSISYKPNELFRQDIDELTKYDIDTYLIESVLKRDTKNGKIPQGSSIAVYVLRYNIRPDHPTRVLGYAVYAQRGMLPVKPVHVMTMHVDTRPQAKKTALELFGVLEQTIINAHTY